MGLTPRNAGDTLGTESTTLTPANLPPPTGVSQPYSNLQPSQGLIISSPSKESFPRMVPGEL